MILRRLAAPTSRAQLLLRVAMTGRGEVPTRNDAEQHVGLLPIEVSAGDRELDSPSSGIFGGFLDARTNADEGTTPPWAMIERSVLLATGTILAE